MRYSTLGRPRRLTDDAVASVIHWRQTRRTLKDIADDLGVSPATVLKAIARADQPVPDGPRVGRPRALAGEQLARVLEWHRSRITRRALARSLGVSDGTLGNALRRGGVYKQASPERRAAALEAARSRRRALLY